MTEGNGHVIDPNGDARRALQEAVAEHGPEVLSNAAVIDSICQDHLAGLPGESILIGDAARTNVPALLSDLIPQLGNYGAIQSAAATLAGEHNLDMAAALWVVREFARALGYIAPATGTSAAFPGSGPRPVPGSGPRPVPGSGPRPVSGSGPRTASGSGPGTGASSAERPTGIGGASGAEGSGMAGTGSEESENARPGGGESGSAVAGGAAAAAAAAAGVAAGQAGRGESAGSESAGSESAASGPGASGSGASGAIDSGAAGPGGASPGGAGASGIGASGVSGTGAGGQAGTGGETIPRGVAASRAAASASRARQAAGDESAASVSDPGYGTGHGGTGQASSSPGGVGQASGAPGTTGTASSGPGAPGPVGGGPGVTGPMGGSGPVGTGPMGHVPGAGGPAAAAAWGGPSAPGGTPGSGAGGGGGWGGAPGGAAPEGEPGFPLPLPAGRLPGRQSQRPKLLNRNTVGIAAAIALIAGYLGVAAVAHLSPFPAKTAPSPSTSQASSPPASTISSPAASPDPSPPSQLSILAAKIPTAVQSRGRCLNAGTSAGASAVIQCQQLQGLAANTIMYYLYPNRTALASGFSAVLKTAKFTKSRECTSASGTFSDFLVECESDFTIKTPGMTGKIAEFANNKPPGPVIVSTDNEQNVMAVMIGTDNGGLLAYWNTLTWVVTP